MQQFFEKLVNSIGGIVIGVILVFVGIFVLYQNEGRVDYSVVAHKAISFETADQDDLAYTTGPIQSQETIGDGLYVGSGSFVSLSRNVEMFAWTEKKSQNNDNTTKTTYKKEWVKSVPDSSEFLETKGHENPANSVESTQVVISKATIGDINVNPSEANLAPEKKLNPSSLNLINIQAPVTTVAGDYVYVGTGANIGPEVGNLRVSYTGFTYPTTVTMYGRADGKSLNMHQGEQERPLYRIFPGTHADAQAVLKQEYQTQGWIMRFLGFFLLWIAIGMIFAPLTTILEVIPVLGHLGKSMIGILSFLLALVIAIVVSVTSMILHNLIAALLVGCLVLACVYFLVIKRKKTV